MRLTNKQIILVGAAVIVIFLIVSIALAYFAPSADPLTTSFKKLYPAAIVGTHISTIADADAFISTAQKLDSSITKSTVYANYLDRIKSEVLLSKLGVKLSSDTVSDEVTFFKHGNESAYNDFVSTYFGGNETLFIDQVVKPSVVEAQLRIKYNSMFAINQEAYGKAQDLLEQINAGAKFEDLAKQYSEDKQTGQLGGDMGFFEHGQIIPELEKEIVIRPTGKVGDIVVTRNGYEIILPIEMATENGVKEWHAKHILIETAGFDQWLTQQLSAIKVTKLKQY